MSACPLTRPWASLSRGARGEGAAIIKKHGSLPPGVRVKASGGAAGVDHETVGEFERHLEENLESLSQLQVSAALRR
jgi:hypothetical protein